MVVRLKGRKRPVQTYQTIVGKNLYVVHRRAQLLGYLPPHTPYGLITVSLHDEIKHRLRGGTGYQMLFQKLGTQQRPHRQESPPGRLPFHSNSVSIFPPPSSPSLENQIASPSAAECPGSPVLSTPHHQLPCVSPNNHASPTAGPLFLPLPLLAMFFPRNGLLSLHFIFAQMSPLQRELPCPSLHDISHRRITFSKLSSFILAHSS